MLLHPGTGVLGGVPGNAILLKGVLHTANREIGVPGGHYAFGRRIENVMRALPTRRPSWSVTSQSTTLVVLPCRRTRASALISPCSMASRKLIFISMVA